MGGSLSISGVNFEDIGVPQDPAEWSPEDMANISAAFFEAVDTSGDGVIDVDELGRFFQEMDNYQTAYNRQCIASMRELQAEVFTKTAEFNKANLNKMLNDNPEELHQEIYEQWQAGQEMNEKQMADMQQHYDMQIQSLQESSAFLTEFKVDAVAQTFERFDENDDSVLSLEEFQKASKLWLQAVVDTSKLYASMLQMQQDSWETQQQMYGSILSGDYGAVSAKAAGKRGVKAYGAATATQKRVPKKGFCC